MTRRVDVYFSLNSTWAYLGHEPFLEIAKRHGVEIGWRPVPLGPLFAETGGLPLPKRSVQRQRYRLVEMQRWAAKRGRPIKLHPKHWPFNPALADSAVLALVAGGEDPSSYIGAGFRGVWEEDRDLRSPDTIAELLAGAGHDAQAVLAAAGAPEIAETYRANHDAGLEANAFGSPTYVLDGETFWGQDRLDMLDEALTSGRPPYRADL